MIFPSSKEEEFALTDSSGEERPETYMEDLISSSDKTFVVCERSYISFKKERKKKRFILTFYRRCQTPEDGNVDDDHHHANKTASHVHHGINLDALGLLSDLESWYKSLGACVGGLATAASSFI